MERRVVVIGGSVAGLAAAVGLARKGWRVTVVERDPGSPTTSGDEAFLEWQRPQVPQFRQPHAFSARSRNLLLDHIPEVVDLLHDDGIEETNVFKLLAPPEMWIPEDDAFTGLMTRRPAFELALRRVAEGEPGVEILSPALATALLYDEPLSAPPRVTGVQLDDGRAVTGDVVLDCGGRRTPVPKWLATVGVAVRQEVQDCEGTYYCRYYRKHSGGIPNVALFGVRGECGGLFFMGFPGDHDTFAIGLFADPQDHELKVLRHDWAFEAAAAAIPSVAPWVADAHARPLHSVEVMAGHHNVRRYYMVDGEPIVLGLLPVGDSLCTTNPQYGWGASMALTYAFAAVEAVHIGADAREMATAYDDAVAAEADAVYRESAAMDRMQIYARRGDPIPDGDRDEMERQNLIQMGVAAGALRDPVLGRALLRRMHLIDRPDAILHDPDVVARAREVREVMAAKGPRKMGPDRDELLAILGAAASVPAG